MDTQFCSLMEFDVEELFQEGLRGYKRLLY